MSTGGGDDDIEDELRRLTNELSELTRLLEASMRQAGGVEEEEEGPSGDLWDVGNVSPKVSSVDEYQQLRSEAASTTTTAAPYFDTSIFDSFDDRVEVRYKLFKRGYDSLQSMYASVSDEVFNAILAEYAVDYLSGDDEAVIPLAVDLVEMLRPGMGMYGVNVVGGTLSVSRRLTPLDFLVSWGEFYYPRSQPWLKLGKREPNNLDDIRGGKSVREFNSDLAHAVFTRSSLDLPEQYVDLLEPEEQAEWRERNE